MQELHPRFRWHTGDWLTRHLVLTHCQVMSRSFAKLGVDPDLAVYQNYLKKQKHDRVTQEALKKRRIEPPRQLVLPGPMVCLSVLRFQQADALEPQALHKPKSAKRPDTTARPSASTTQITRKTTAPDDVGPSSRAIILSQDEDMSHGFADVSHSI